MSKTPEQPAAPWFETLDDGTEALHVALNLDGLTLGDLEMLDSYSDTDNPPPMRDILALLNKIVVGGVRDIPVTKLPALFEAVEAEIRQVADPFDKPTEA